MPTKMPTSAMDHRGCAKCGAMRKGPGLMERGGMACETCLSDMNVVASSASARATETLGYPCQVVPEVAEPAK